MGKEREFKRGANYVRLNISPKVGKYWFWEIIIPQSSSCHSWTKSPRVAFSD